MAGFRPAHMDAINYRKCVELTDRFAHMCNDLSITPTELLFVMTQMLVSLCQVKGYDWDKIVDAMQGFYKTARERRSGIILT
jgi:hypothetical protein